MIEYHLASETKHLPVISYGHDLILMQKRSVKKKKMKILYTAQQKFSTDFVYASSFIWIRNNLFLAINTYG